MNINKEIRRFALMVLNDENGIREDAYRVLEDILNVTRSSDVVDTVDVAQGRAYIGEDESEEMLRDISKWEEAQGDKLESLIKQTEEE